jgi:hypothetical protein
MMSKPITTTNHPLHHIDYHYRHWNILSQIWSPLTVLSSLPFSRHHQNATTIPWFLDGFFYNHLVNVALYEKHQPISTCMSMPTLSYYILLWQRHAAHSEKKHHPLWILINSSGAKGKTSEHNQHGFNQTL